MQDSIEDEHSYDPALGHGLPHNPMKAIIAPRPIGWISTIGPDGIANLAPYSFFNIVAETPPILMFSAGLRNGGRKDAVRDIDATGEFAFNLATRSFAHAMNVTSSNWPKDTDEFEKAGLAKAKSDIIAAPRVAGSPVSLECKLLDIRRIVDLDGRNTNDEIVMGQVIRVHIRKDFLVEGIFDLVKAGTIARAGYRGDYVTVTESFEMLPASLP